MLSATSADADISLKKVCATTQRRLAARDAYICVASLTSLTASAFSRQVRIEAEQRLGLCAGGLKEHREEIRAAAEAAAEAAKAPPAKKVHRARSKRHLMHIGPGSLSLQAKRSQK